MWVTVPVTDRSRSPSTSETPTAPPGSRSGSGSAAGAARRRRRQHRREAEAAEDARAPTRRSAGRSPRRPGAAASGVSDCAARAPAAGRPRQRAAVAASTARSGRCSAAMSAARSSGQPRAAGARGAGAKRAEAARGACGARGLDHLADGRDAARSSPWRTGSRRTTAPTSLPSMKTGLPLMPAITPVLRERAALEPGEDHALLGPDVLEHADDLDLELVDAACPRRRCGRRRSCPGCTSASGRISGRVGPGRPARTAGRPAATAKRAATRRMRSTIVESTSCANAMITSRFLHARGESEDPWRTRGSCRRASGRRAAGRASSAWLLPGAGHLYLRRDRQGPRRSWSRSGRSSSLGVAWTRACSCTSASTIRWPSCAAWPRWRSACPTSSRGRSASRRAA